MKTEIKWDFPDWSASIKKRARDVLIEVAAAMQLNRARMFDAEGADNGKEKWAPLKFRNGVILSDRGTLRKSWAPPAAMGKPGPSGIVRIGADSVTIGSTLAYAEIMNWGTTKLPGGVIKPKTAKALKIPLPAGKSATPELSKAFGKKRKGKYSIGKGQFIFRKSVKIPMRRMDIVSEQDMQEFEEAFNTAVARFM